MTGARVLSQFRIFTYVPRLPTQYTAERVKVRRGCLCLTVPSSQSIPVILAIADLKLLLSDRMTEAGVLVNRHVRFIAFVGLPAVVPVDTLHTRS